MADKAFHIIVAKDRILLNWGSQQGVPYSMASGLEKDRLIARILHKILNLRLSVENGGVLGKDEFRVLGATLFKLLFNDEKLLTQFSTFYRESLGSPSERYRLILEFEKEAQEMAVLPWEYLFYEKDEVQEAFLAAHPKKCLDLIRKLPFKGNWLELDKTATQIEPPLKVLVIAASPDTDLAIGNLRTLIAYFETLEKHFPNKIDVEIILQPEVDLFEQQLQQIIQNGTFFPHIIHFIGRGRMEGENGQLCFVKRNADGKFDENWISDDAFAGYFEEWRRLPHLVVLDICDGSPIGNYQEDRGLAVRLVKKGVPFVLALQNPTQEWMAELLVEKLYENLLEGTDLAAAVTEARFFLARKLMDTNGRKYDNYEHKVFGSPMLLTSVLQPFALAKNEIAATPQPSSASYKICPNHPQVKFIPSESRCSLCSAQLLFPGEQPERQREKTRSAEIKISEPVLSESTTTGRVGAESTQRSAAPKAEALTTAGHIATADLKIENAKLTAIKKYFKQLIQDNNLQEVLEQLRVAVAFDSNDIYNSVVVQYSRFEDINKKVGLNLVDGNTASITYSQIMYALLTTVDALKVMDVESSYFVAFDRA